MRTNIRLLLTISMLAWLVGACASSEFTPDERRADYVLVYLKTGPLAAAKSAEEKQQIFSGHMANMQRLADERRLLIAGPFDHPQDASWRGIFVLDVPTPGEALALVETDPGVQAQVFAVECVPMSAARVLRTSLDLERARKAQLATAGKSEADPSGFDIRGYVMITAKDGERAQRALAPLEAANKLVWCGRLGDRHAGQGVFVLDAEKVEDANVLLGAARAELGECSIDSWWSSKSLRELALTHAR